jgi:hypothetical protein
MLVASCWFIVFLTVLDQVWFSNAFQQSPGCEENVDLTRERAKRCYKDCRSRLHSDLHQRASRGQIRRLSLNNM